MRLPVWANETAVVSIAYLATFYMTFELLIPLQDAYFPEFLSHASLLFLPHGVRVLAAWLLGWRSVVALGPGVFLAFFSVAGLGVFTPSRLIGILIAVIVPAATFHAFKLVKWNLSPRSDQMPCWPCIMAAGIAISILSSLLTNYVLGSGPQDYLAYLVGDTIGLFFLMMMLMFFFRILRRYEA